MTSKNIFPSPRATLSQTRVSKERTHSIENHTSKHLIPTTLGLLKHIRLPPRMLIISHYDATHLSMENHNEDNVHHCGYRRFAGYLITTFSKSNFFLHTPIQDPPFLDIIFNRYHSLSAGFRRMIFRQCQILLNPFTLFITPGR